MICSLNSGLAWQIKGGWRNCNGELLMDFHLTKEKVLVLEADPSINLCLLEIVTHLLVIHVLQVHSDFGVCIIFQRWKVE